MNTQALLQLFHGGEGKGGSLNDLLISHLDSLGLIKDDALQKSLLQELLRSYVHLEQRVDGLLKNTLPAQVAEEIKHQGQFSPRACHCTILFTDFVGFTRLAELIPQEKLVETLHHLFSGFDQLVASFGGTKIKTIGDAYMVVFGAPEELPEHGAQAIRAALAMMAFVDDFNREQPHPFQMRVGIHSGPVMAGVVGRERMQFDVFGDNVNIASRFESSGSAGRINVSETTYLQVKTLFDFEPRGRIALKNKEAMEAYFVIAARNVSSSAR